MLQSFNCLGRMVVNVKACPFGEVLLEHVDLARQPLGARLPSSSQFYFCWKCYLDLVRLRWSKVRMIVSKLQVLGRVGLQQRQLLKLQLPACHRSHPWGNPSTHLHPHHMESRTAHRIHRVRAAKKRDSIASGAFVDALWTHALLVTGNFHLIHRTWTYDQTRNKGCWKPTSNPAEASCGWCQGPRVWFILIHPLPFLGHNMWHENPPAIMVLAKHHLDPFGQSWIHSVAIADFTMFHSPAW